VSYKITFHENARMNDNDNVGLTCKGNCACCPCG